MKWHLELFDTIEVGLARVGVETHVAHVPYECRIEGVELGNGFAEFGGGEFASLDMNVSNERNVEVANVPRLGHTDGRCVAGCAKACHSRE